MMREMYNRFAKKNKGYSERDFQGIVEEIADENLGDFSKLLLWNTLFEGILAPALEQVGLQIKMKRNLRSPNHYLAQCVRLNKEKQL